MIQVHGAKPNMRPDWRGGQGRIPQRDRWAASEGHSIIKPFSTPFSNHYQTIIKLLSNHFQTIINTSINTSINTIINNIFVCIQTEYWQEGVYTELGVRGSTYLNCDGGEDCCLAARFLIILKTASQTHVALRTAAHCWQYARDVAPDMPWMM